MVPTGLPPEIGTCRGTLLIALEEAADLLGAAIARGEMDGESARRWMIALFTAVAAIGDGIPRVSASRFACDC